MIHIFAPKKQKKILKSLLFGYNNNYDCKQEIRITFSIIMNLVQKKVYLNKKGTKNIILAY